MTLSLGFASCSDDDDPVTEGNVVPATELSAVANTYVNDIINPTYKDLRDNAKVLKDACDKAYANAKAGTWRQNRCTGWYDEKRCGGKSI